MSMVTRSFRLDKKLLQNVARLARKYGMTENHLVTSWLVWRIGFDPLIPTFDGLLLTTETFQSILGTCDIDSIETIAFELGKKHFTMAKTLFEASGVQLTFRMFMAEILSSRARWFTIEGGDETEAPRQLLLQHKLSIKWSIFLKGYLSGAYESMSHGRLNTTLTENFIRLKFEPPPEESSRRF